MIGEQTYNPLDYHPNSFRSPAGGAFAMQAFCLTRFAALVGGMKFSISAGWKRQHGGKDTPSNWRSPLRPGEKSPEQGRSYNRLNREIDRRREGGGGSV